MSSFNEMVSATYKRENGKRNGQFSINSRLTSFASVDRYVNTDYVVGSTCRHHHPKTPKLLSYDVICQYCKDFIARLKKLPPLVRLHVVRALWQFVIPKMHIHGHKQECQDTYSLNTTPGSANTDGEGIERPWADIGPVSTSTREMGPGSRHDTLDDHWGHWNWQKKVGLGEFASVVYVEAGWLTCSVGLLLLKRWLRAVDELAAQEEAFEAFTSNQLAEIPAWKKSVEDYENDPTKPNPYQMPKSSTCIPPHPRTILINPFSALTVQDVRLQLAKEDAALAAAGVPSLHDVTPGEFLLAGLDLEDQQCVYYLSGGD